MNPETIRLKLDVNEVEELLGYINIQPNNKIVSKLLYKIVKAITNQTKNNEFLDLLTRISQTILKKTLIQKTSLHK